MAAAPDDPTPRAPSPAAAAPPSPVAGRAPADGGLTTPSERGVTAPPAPSYGRAGRNLVAAIGVGAVLGGLILASLFVQKVLFVGLVVVAITVAVVELSGALRARAVRVPLVPAVIGGAAMLVAAYVGGAEALTVGLFLTAVAVFAWRLGEPGEGYVRDTTAGVFTAAYVPFLAGFAVLLTREDDGAWRVLVFLLAVVASDIGGYLFGVLFGRHPMAPTVSPKKSWEGFAGSLVLCVSVCTATVVLALDGSWTAGVLLGLAVLGSATLGDLGESLVKRDLGVKDMGDLLPGHGGIMDRLDSMLPTAPVAWLVLSALVPA
jgi:phosphatidate cytidylyltransferase